MQYKPHCGESTLLKKLCKYVTNSISCHSFFGLTLTFYYAKTYCH